MVNVGVDGCVVVVSVGRAVGVGMTSGTFCQVTIWRLNFLNATSEKNRFRFSIFYDQ